MPFIPTFSHFLYIIGLLALGSTVAGYTIFIQRQSLANYVSHGCAALAGLLGTLVSFSILETHTIISHTASSPFPALTYAFRIDELSAFFMLIISLAAMATSVYGIGYVRRDTSIRPGVFGFFYCLFIASLYLVTAANNALFFLLAWECMSLTSYFLIVHEHDHGTTVHAGHVYFVMTAIGTACLTLALLILGHAVNSYDFDVLRSAAHTLPPLLTHSALLFALLGLGIKAGMVPLHIWLPKAHPAAASHVSALLSGVMLKMAILMIIRFFFDFFGLPHTLWWGIVLLVLGSASALLGVLYALAESDLKKLLAYSSVENIGIVLMAIGGAALFSGTGAYALAAVALSAALMHSLNHAMFKGLLFLAAGSVVQTTGARTMERYGGLIRRIPSTALLFLIGALAIAGIPPLNGFVSEWTTFTALFSGVSLPDLYMKALFVAALGVLVLVSGLAAASFVKAFGITFLARPRGSLPAGHAWEKRESFNMVLGMGMFALFCGLFGLFASRVLTTTMSVLQPLGLSLEDKFVRLLGGEHVVYPSPGEGVELPFLLLALVAGAGIAFVATFRRSTSRARVTGPVWSCGAPLEAPLFAGVPERTEITGAGFAQTLVVVFRPLMPSRVRKAAVTHVADTGAREHLRIEIVDVWRTYFYEPVQRTFFTIAKNVQKLQNGNVNVYLLYMLVALCLLLLVSL